VIGYLQGKIIKKDDDRVLILANQVGYEVLVPAVVMGSLADKTSATWLCIYYQQTERQPKPV
jgi:Holliday junction DNA helicase RuvA